MSTTLGVADLQHMLAQPTLPNGFVVPKLESVEELTLAIGLIEQEENRRKEATGESVHLSFIGIIESPKAVLDAKEIMSCKAAQRLNAVIFGGDDYAQMMGATRTDSNHELNFARNMVLMTASAYNIQAIDIVQKSFKNTEALRKECQEAAEMGYTGKQLIHPAQVTHANELFAPSKELLAWAKSVVDADREHQAMGTGAFSLNGLMVDMPTVKLAQKIWDRGVACGVQ
jgi:citrate lyase subunit beta-like protein